MVNWEVVEPGKIRLINTPYIIKYTPELQEIQFSIYRGNKYIGRRSTLEDARNVVVQHNKDLLEMGVDNEDSN